MEHKSFLLKHFSKCRKTPNEFGGKTYWFDSPYHLYYEKEQAFAYLEMIGKNNFAETLHLPIEKLVEKYASSLVGNESNKIELYDLGPGLPTKTLPILRYMQERNISFKYIPVDISTSFLKVAIEEVKKIGIESEGINCLFEDLPSVIQKKTNPKITRIFLIGLTFNNYRPNQILNLLDSLCKPNDFALIITEFYKKGKEESILLPYKDIYAENFNFLVLKLMGLYKKDFTYFANFNNHRIEMGFKPINEIQTDSILLKNTDKIITAISYRYSTSSITSYIQKYFKHFEYYQQNDIVIFKIKE